MQISKAVARLGGEMQGVGQARQRLMTRWLVYIGN